MAFAYPTTFRKDFMKKKTKKPIDSTLRNVRAANKRIKALELKVDWIESVMKSQGYYVYADIQELKFKRQPARRGRK